MDSSQEARHSRQERRAPQVACSDRKNLGLTARTLMCVEGRVISEFPDGISGRRQLRRPRQAAEIYNKRSS